MRPLTDDDRPAVHMDWHNLLFLHWPLPPQVLRPLIPSSLQLDTFDGRAYVGLVPFTMRNVRHAGWPPVPTMHHFHECNVRTYVRLDDQPGVWFCSLDAVSQLAVWGARLVWNLPYHKARISLRRDGARTHYRVRRHRMRRHGGRPAATTDCVWDAGPHLPQSAPGSLEHFLTERYALYCCDRRGRVYRGRIAHQPWPLQSAHVVHLDDGLLAAAGIVMPREPPLAHHAEQIETKAYPLQRVADRARR